MLKLAEYHLISQVDWEDFSQAMTEVIIEFIWIHSSGYACFISVVFVISFLQFNQIFVVFCLYIKPEIEVNKCEEFINLFIFYKNNRSYYIIENNIEEFNNKCDLINFENLKVNNFWNALVLFRHEF